MTALTFQQRRADFEEMLNHAARVMDYNRRLHETTPETPGGLWLVSLTKWPAYAASGCRLLPEAPPASPRASCPAP